MKDFVMSEPQGYYEDEYIVINGKDVHSCKTYEDALKTKDQLQMHNDSGAIGSYPGVSPEIRKNPAYSPIKKD